MSTWWLWFLLVAFFANDWPWFLILVAVAWVFHALGTITAGWAVAAVAALALEAVLFWLRPRKSTGAPDVAMEGAALGGSVILWGTFAGLAMWQAALGFDAASRLHTLVKTGGYRVLLRSLRAVAGVVFLLAYHGLGPR